MNDFLSRLTSRKFLMAVFALVCVFVAPDQMDKIIQILALFIGAEGAADVAQRIKGVTYTIKPESAQQTTNNIASDLVSGAPYVVPITDITPQVAQPTQQYYPGLPGQ